MCNTADPAGVAPVGGCSERFGEMRLQVSVAVIAGLIGAQQTMAQGTSEQPGSGDPQVLAQAYDRCMATQGVRLTRTSMSDEAIFAQAFQSCSDVPERLSGALKAQLPARQAGEILDAMAAQAKPSFMTLLTKIRTDRVSRSAPAGGPSVPLAQSSLDPANPAHCEIAFTMLAAMTEIVSPAHVPEVQRRLAAAREQTAARMRPEEAVAARKAAWPLLKDQHAIVSLAEACSKMAAD